MTYDVFLYHNKNFAKHHVIVIVKGNSESSATLINFCFLHKNLTMGDYSFSRSDSNASYQRPFTINRKTSVENHISIFGIFSHFFLFLKIFHLKNETWIDNQTHQRSKFYSNSFRPHGDLCTKKQYGAFHWIRYNWIFGCFYLWIVSNEMSESRDSLYYEILQHLNKMF